MDAFITQSKEFSHRRRTDSGLMSESPALIMSVSLTAGDGGAATARLLDGHSSHGDIKVDLSAPANSVDRVTFSPPLWVDQGLWLEVDDNVTSVVVQILQVRRNGTPKQKSTLRNWLPSWLGGYETQREST